MNSKTNIQKQIEYYNQRWSNEEYINKLKLIRCISILSAFEQIIQGTPHILELGCGSGWLAGILGNWGPTTGVDLSEEGIKKARKKYPYVEFVQSDIMTLPQPWDFFDVIISHEVIEHIEDQKKYIQIAYNFLKPGGYLILTTPNKKILDAFPEPQKLSWSNQPIEKWLSIKALREVITPEFNVINLTTIIPGYDAAGLLRYLNSHKLREFVKMLGLSSAYERIYLSLGFGLHIFLVAKKGVGRS